MPTFYYYVFQDQSLSTDSMGVYQFLYARRRQDVLWDHPWPAGGWASGRAGGWASGRAASTSLSGAYLQNYSSYGYEISWVDRSHQGGVQCAGIITLASLIFQLLPFVFFHT